jgi:peptidoglycan/LPS O-acetylase OafA/YrhL
LTSARDTSAHCGDSWLDLVPARWPVLALVRMAMALTVVVYHLSIVSRTARVPVLELFGGIGCICGFLVISGYSIAHSVRSQPRGFYRRRLWRILPVYYGSLLLALLPYLFERAWPPFRASFAPPDGQQILGSLLFLQCFLTDKVAVFGPSWTLAVEWWFYMLAPLFVRMRHWQLGLLVFASLWFEGTALAHGFFPIHVYRWGIPAGMLLWAWLSGFLFYRQRGWSGPLVVLVGYYAVNLFVDRSPAAYLLAAVMVVVADGLPRIPQFLARFLNYLGDLSYPLYLVHVPTMAWLGRVTRWTDPYIFIAASFAAAALVHHGIDGPLRRAFGLRRHGA